ncbi:FtsB family cell division protein [Bacillus solimangrovi]|uniref:Cell division protein DIVIC n=1 Tax=Bacillus solimangrovi TaxID=1305675 RepID=A0A1E5LEZ2_9BACI|nr:septum formation initiator family protein [Bacillus solimangrovi]OEH92642.1 hypothetical protein BFG57_14840 [Bacillus solimangrovi]
MQTGPKRNITKIRSSYTVQHDRKQEVKRIRTKMLKRRLIMFAAFVLVVTVMMTVTFMTQSKAIGKKELEKENLEKKLALLQKEEVSLKEEITKLNDVDYIKKLARRDYFFSEEGEVIFQFSDDSPSY